MTDQPQLPRIIGVLATLAVLAYVNHAAPRVLPAVLALVVLYAALTNLERAQALLGAPSESLGRLIHPATPPATPRAPRRPS